MELIIDEEVWAEMEQHGMPCRIKLVCEYKRAYTGPGKEYVSMGSIENEYIPLTVDEVKRDRENVLWGRLKSGAGWIELKDVRLSEQETEGC